MKTFERSLLLHLLELYDAHLSSGYSPPKKKLEMIEELREALFKPHRMKCYAKKDRTCYYSMSSYHMKPCPGYKNCLVGMSKKRDETEIKFR